VRRRTAGSWLAACVTLAALAAAPSGAAQAPPAAASPPPALAVGDTVPVFDAEGVDGQRKQVSYGKEGTVLLFFLSGCPTCHKMLPEWNRAYERRPKGLQVVGILMDREPPGFFMATPITFPVVRSPGREFTNTFKVQKVPLTIRVGAGGKVQDVGMGQLDPIRLGQFFRPAS
jgi:hypothetical protein